MSELRLSTRGSVLALTQSRVVADLLQERGHAVTIEVIPTTGDRDQTQPLPEIGGTSRISMFPSGGTPRVGLSRVSRARMGRPGKWGRFWGRSGPVKAPFRGVRAPLG